MTAGSKRLDKLFPALTARERGILVLKSLKDGTEEDPQIRLSMPHDQTGEFNHYIGLMNAANINLAALALVVEQMVEQLNLRYAWLTSIRLWQMQANQLVLYLSFFTKEPIIESEYRRRLEEARSEMVPAADLAETQVERYDGWTEADLEPWGDAEEQVVSDAAWERELAAREREIAHLVETGVLAGRKRGRRLLVNQGSFYDWLGEPVPVPADWGSGYDVFPDEKAGEVRMLQRARLRARETLAKAVPEAAPRPSGKQNRRRKGCEGEAFWVEMAGALETRLRNGIQIRWQELRAIETVWEEIAQEFDGEDPARPEIRQVVEQSKKKLEELRRELSTGGETFDLPEPEAEGLEMVKKVVERGVRLYS